jgi:hypothetical protein
VTRIRNIRDWLTRETSIPHWTLILVAICWTYLIIEALLGF